jgi:predicted glycoside hydrolase/deacetylase ChbG (UPF0249 family)
MRSFRVIVFLLILIICAFPIFSTQSIGGAKKVIFRADDFGYSKAGNDGAIKAIDDGVVTMVELMPDTPGAVDAMERIRERPWISVNWHAHFWGRPVLGAEKVPSLVDKSGRFKQNYSTHRVNPEGMDYGELVAECRAEIKRCIKIMGRAPDATAGLGNDVIGRAMKAVCEEFGIAYGYYGDDTPTAPRKFEANPKWADRKIYEYENFGSPGLLLVDYEKYDPLASILKMDLTRDRIWMRSQHPGYVDDIIWADTWEICSVHRIKDVMVLCSEELKQWVRNNNVELINLRDALYGTHEYQNHLKEIRSDLACRK